MTFYNNITKTDIKPKIDINRPPKNECNRMRNSERRLKERFNFDIPVQISRDPQTLNHGVPGKASVANISSGGVFILTDEIFPLASKVYLKFLITYDQLKKLRFILSYKSLQSYHGQEIWVTATGIVIRTEEHGVAIIFDENYQLSPLEG